MEQSTTKLNWSNTRRNVPAIGELIGSAYGDSVVMGYSAMQYADSPDYGAPVLYYLGVVVQVIGGPVITLTPNEVKAQLAGIKN